MEAKKIKEQYSNRHNEIVSALKQIDGYSDVKHIHESPNKYGNVTSSISFKYNVEDMFNYTKGGVSIDYKINQLFMPDKGYFIIDDLNVKDVIALIKKHNKISK